MPPARKPQSADERANEALDRATMGATPARRTLDFLLKDSHAEPRPTPDQTQTVPAPVPTQTRPKPSEPVAPERDFNRRANSIDREALPAGTFPGFSKKIYDALYLRTRGAVAPSRSIQATRREIMRWAGVRDIKTVNVHLRKLETAGLVRRTNISGEHEGCLYEVLLPEEASQTSPRPIPDQSQTSPEPEGGRKTDSDQDQKMVWVGSGNPVDSQGTSGDPKTSFKTNTEQSDDDEAFAGFVSALKKTARELTGREPSPAEKQRWEEVAEVLVTELRIAAGRTTVSSVPSFFAEHLRRRLFKKDRAQLAGEEKEAPPVSTKVDASQCPDCYGTGMWYPEGYEKGVAKCRHEKLADVSRTQ